MKFNGIKIRGVSSYLPTGILTNDDIAKTVATSDEWIVKKLGIKERRISGPHETISYMGHQAAASVIRECGMHQDEIGMIIVATSSPEKISPSTACTIHKMLGISKNCPAFDINAVCSGFVYAITIAASLINSGAYENIMVIASESYSSHTDWSNPHCVFFGDGAGAIIITKDEKSTMWSKIEANGAGTGMTGFTMPLNGTFDMRGKEVWDQAISVLPQSIKDVLDESGLSNDDIKMLVPHQPSINILKIIAEKLDLPFEKVKTVMDKYANLAGASIPVALHEAIKANEIQKGDRILMTAIGSGWAWGSIIIDY